MLTFPRSRLVGIGSIGALLIGCAHGHSDRANKSPRASATPVVDSQTIDHNPNEPIEETLMGRYPGVLVNRTADGGIAVTIRGGSSINSSNMPLYVIDGIPIEPGPGGSLQGINPHDIASIEVLKDAASTAIYGPRGVNGVIIIKIKRP